MLEDAGAGPRAATNASSGLRLLLAEHERLREAWRRQLHTTIEALDELEAQRRLLVSLAATGPDPDAGTGATPGVSLPALLAGYERNVIRWALANSDGNQKEAAALLRIPATTLHEKMKRLRLLPGRPANSGDDEIRHVDMGPLPV